jgi:hypothetical protein
VLSFPRGVAEDVLDISGGEVSVTDGVGLLLALLAL